MQGVCISLVLFYYPVQADFQILDIRHGSWLSSFCICKKENPWHISKLLQQKNRVIGNCGRQCAWDCFAVMHVWNHPGCSVVFKKRHKGQLAGFFYDEFHPAKPAAGSMHDIGILASADPVALDQACVDLIYEQKNGDGASLVNRIESRNGLLTLEHAQEIGLGNRVYTLVDIDR